MLHVAPFHDSFTDLENSERTSVEVHHQIVRQNQIDDWFTELDTVQLTADVNLSDDTTSHTIYILSVACATLICFIDLYLMIFETDALLGSSVDLLVAGFAIFNLWTVVRLADIMSIKQRFLHYPLNANFGIAFWIEVAEYLLRAVCLIFVCLGAVEFWIVNTKLSDSPFGPFLFYYLYSSFIAKIVFVFGEFIYRTRLDSRT